MTTRAALVARLLAPVTRATAEGLARLGLEPVPELWGDEDEPVAPTGSSISSQAPGLVTPRRSAPAPTRQSLPRLPEGMASFTGVQQTVAMPEPDAANVSAFGGRPSEGRKQHSVAHSFTAPAATTRAALVRSAVTGPAGLSAQAAVPFPAPFVTSRDAVSIAPSENRMDNGSPMPSRPPTAERVTGTADNTAVFRAIQVARTPAGSLPERATIMPPVGATPTLAYAETTLSPGRIPVRPSLSLPDNQPSYGMLPQHPADIVPRDPSETDTQAHRSMRAFAPPSSRAVLFDDLPDHTPDRLSAMDGTPSVAPRVHGSINLNVTMESGFDPSGNGEVAISKEALRDILLEFLRDDARREGIDV